MGIQKREGKLGKLIALQTTINYKKIVTRQLLSSSQLDESCSNQIFVFASQLDMLLSGDVKLLQGSVI